MFRAIQLWEDDYGFTGTYPAGVTAPIKYLTVTYKIIDKTTSGHPISSG